MSETDYFGLMIITASTVAKIMLCAIVGMVVSRYFNTPELSEKGLSYISVQVFLPCLLFSNLCLNVTMDDVKRYYWAPILACIPVVLGLTGATLLSSCNVRKYRGLLLLGSSFQNGLTFPVSVVVNLKGIDWFGAEEAKEAQRYIFLYNIICSIGLWAIGDPLIAHYKTLDDAQEKAEAASHALAQRQADVGDDGPLENRSFDFPYMLPDGGEELSPCPVSADASGQTTSRSARHVRPSPVSGTPTMAVESPRKRTATAHEQLHWYQPPGEEDAPMTCAVSPTADKDRKIKDRRDGGAGDGDTDEEEDRLVDLRELSTQLNMPDGTWTLPPGLSALSAADEDRRRRGCGGSQAPTEGSDGTTAQDSKKRNYGAIVLRAVQSRPVFVSLLALAISLVPPLRWCAQTFPAKMFIGGFTIVGNGAIPLQLLVLGCNVVSSRPKPVEASAPGTTAAPAETEPTAASSASPSTGDTRVTQPSGEDGDERRGGCLSCLSVENMFMVSSIGVRMFAIPCISFLVIHLMRIAGVLPNERPFLLAMLVAVNSPSAINSALICSMHDYHARVYSQMIFFMYITSIFTATIGLFFFILYLN